MIYLHSRIERYLLLAAASIRKRPLRLRAAEVSIRVL